MDESNSLLDVHVCSEIENATAKKKCFLLGVIQLIRYQLLSAEVWHDMQRLGLTLCPVFVIKIYMQKKRPCCLRQPLHDCENKNVVHDQTFMLDKYI